MNNVNSSYRSFRNLFERGIAVRDISEPLASFDKNAPIEQVLNLMNSKRFDIVGVRDIGHIIGYAKREDLTSGLIGDFVVSFQPEDIIQDHEPLFKALDCLKNRRWAIVNILNHTGGIITRGDLQKQPVRMWLFGIISILEMQLSEQISHEFEEAEWLSLINDDREEKARCIFIAREKDGIDINLLECIQICDKSTIIQKSKKLRNTLGLTSKKEARELFNFIQKLRDSLAHSNQLVSASWPEYVLCAEKIGELLTSLEI